jgi:hypothetical protein
MNRNDVLEGLASQYNLHSNFFEDECGKSKPVSGIPTMKLIDDGAVLGGFAGYLKKGNDSYEPCEYRKLEFLDEGIVAEANIPVSYSKRGEILEGIDNS